MNTNRRCFLRTACLSGLCACTTGSVAADTDTPTPNADAPAADPMPYKWIAALLPGLSKLATRQEAKEILKGCSTAHYVHLGMDGVIAPFKGKLDDFLTHLTQAWGWKINYDREARVILIDEAKSKCVCPLVQDASHKGLSILCDCSEGFAEKMFSSVVGHPVQASVTASILRGASSCQYRITL